MKDYEVGKNKPPKEHQFKPGQSGNPEGGRLYDPIKRAIKNLNKKEMEEIINLLTSSTKEELKKIAEDPETPILKVWLCSIMAKGIKTGDHRGLEFIFDRKLGKVKQELDVDIDQKVTERRVVVVLPDNGRS